jgi:hypothetical protein
MNESKRRFLELAVQYEATKDLLNGIREKLEESMKEVGLDQYVQDPETLLVYKIVKPNGTFMYYRDIDFKRTAKEGEKGGNVLAKKEVLELGFELTKR